MSGLIVNLRGPSGSGKSYVGSKLYETFGPPVDQIRTTRYFNRKKPKLIAEILPGGLCMAGRYVMQKSTLSSKKGYSTGVDGFFPVVELEEMLAELAGQYPFMFMESLMLSGTYGRWAEWATKRDQRVAFVTLDTPADKCIQRIYERNGGKEIKEGPVRASHRAVQNAHKKFAKDGTGILVPHVQSFEVVLQLLLDAGWDPGKPPHARAPEQPAPDYASIIGPSVVVPG